jgi:hypothetical protein
MWAAEGYGGDRARYDVRGKNERRSWVGGSTGDVYDECIVSRMIRKQVYLREDEESRLKQAAKRLGITESELVRRGIDEVTAQSAKGPRDPEAWDELMAFARERAKIKVPQTGRTWTRDDLYEND